jgi:hypothetical protein
MVKTVVDTIAPAARPQDYRPQISPTALAHDDIARVLAQTAPLPERYEITDSTAVTIGEWWASAGYTAFDRLAEGKSCSLVSLLGEIRQIRLDHPNLHADDARSLDCLATWAINHPSRAEESFGRSHAGRTA